MLWFVVVGSNGRKETQKAQKIRGIILAIFCFLRLIWFWFSVFSF